MLPSPALMTGHALPWTLQTALSDVVGAGEECNFEQRQEGQPPKAIGMVTSSRTGHSHPLLSGERRLAPISMGFHSRKSTFGSGQSAFTQRLPLSGGSRPLRFLPSGTMKERGNHNSGVTSNS